MTTPTKPQIRFFVSYAHTDEKKRAEFLSALKDRLKNSKLYEFRLWSDHQLDAGVGWRDEIKVALGDCDFGLLLVSNAFFASEFITKEELPGFVDGIKPCIPVCLVKVDLANIDTKGLADRQIFHLKGKAFSQCAGNTKTDFVNTLANQIETRVSAYLASNPASSGKTVSHDDNKSAVYAPPSKSGSTIPPLTAEEENKIRSVFGSQFARVAQVIEMNKELRDLLIRAFNVPTELTNGETTLRLLVHFHSSFIETLGQFDRMYRQGEQRDAIVDFVSMIMFLAMCPDFADHMKQRDKSSAIEIPKDARQGLVALLTSWVQGDEHFPLREVSKEKAFGEWESIPKDRLFDKQSALMKQHGIDPTSADAQRLLKSKLFALKNAGVPAWLVISEEDRDLLPELLREGSPFEHMLILVKTAEATIHARRGKDYHLNFEDQLEHLLETLSKSS